MRRGIERGEVVGDERDEAVVLGEFDQAGPIDGLGEVAADGLAIGRGLRPAGAGEEEVEFGGALVVR